MDKPTENKTYALTAPTGSPSIANGTTWKESEVKTGALTVTVGANCPIDVNKLRKLVKKI